MKPTLVQRLEVRALDIPLHEPFGIAQGAQAIAQNLLVTIDLADGTRGLGEAAPFPAFNGETQASARAAIEAARGIVEGADVSAWRTIARDLAAAGAPGSARCAIETAVLDALTRRAGMPLHVFFGGATSSLETDVTVTTGTAARASEVTRAHAKAGFRAIKIKVGGVARELDVARVHAIVSAAPGVALTLDANASLTAAEAIALIEAIRAQGIAIALFEQPVAGGDLEGLREVGARTGVRVAADESLASAADALRIARDRSAGVLNIKLMKTGIVESLDIAAIARAAGIGLMIGGMVESMLAMTTSACFAAGLGGFDFVDLDTPMFLAENPFRGGYAQSGPRLDLSGIVAGHGVRPARVARVTESH